MLPPRGRLGRTRHAGLLRSHEFDKVEILAVATAEQAPALLDELVARAEAMIVALELPYRTSRSAPATSVRATTAASTSRSTRPAPTSGWRSRR